MIFPLSRYLVTSLQIASLLIVRSFSNHAYGSGEEGAAIIKIVWNIDVNQLLFICMNRLRAHPLRIIQLRYMTHEVACIQLVLEVLYSHTCPTCIVSM